MDKVLRDTDTYSEVIKRRNAEVSANASDYLAEFECFTISTLSIFEMVWGLERVKRTAQLEKLVQDIVNLDILQVDTEISLLAGRIHGELVRMGQLVGTTDSMIAATAIHHNLTLVTGNLKHYERIQTLGYPLRLENWRLA